LKFYIIIQGAAGKLPQQKLQFLKTRWIFYYEILYDYAQWLTALLLHIV